MNLIPTEKLKAIGHTIESMRAADPGWTDAVLVSEGYAVVAPEPAPAAKASPFPKPLPNVLGVADLAAVQTLYNDLAPIANFPNGFSFMQHILLVADRLARARGLK